ncbi:hypothetical protein [uncultured Veillonella sp.]|uniref:hypothetical protein n=1 Tax=uncultured Veillonella sp. TaxID=159268 RepID=UPI0025E9E116|nr:hypothetical protein [uncultured Veillonella sp.]
MKKSTSTKTTLKTIKAFRAIDVTNATYEEMQEIRNNNRIEPILYSVGIYGISGIVFRAGDNFYKIIERCPNLYNVL